MDSTARLGRVARWLGPVAILLLFFFALHVLRGELRTHGYREIMRAMQATPPRQLLAALALTLFSYIVLFSYDALALAYAGRTGDRRIPLRRIVFGAGVAYGLSQTLGFPAVTGSAVRFRFWSAWGLSSAEIAQAAAFSGATFTLGVVFMSGLALLLEPAATLARVDLPDPLARSLGVLLTAGVVAYVAWSIARGGERLTLPRWLSERSAALGRVEIPVPPASFAITQVGVALLDWTAAAAVLYVLLPQYVDLGFLAFAGIFVLAQFTGLLSHVPGGAGVFETMIVLLLGPHLGAGQALGAALAYRGIYYVLPFAAAVAATATYEVVTRRAQFMPRVAAVLGVGAATAARTGGAVARVGPAVVPAVASLATFAAGTILLFSGATPSVRGRITLLDALLPLGVIEASHLLASVAGAALLVLAWALRHRIGAAWGLTVALLATGIVTSLLKGLDWEEALLLTLVLSALVPFRRAFYRRAALTAEPFEPGWVLSIAAVLGASIWLGFLSFRHVELTSDVWWRVRPHADAPRFLRASVASSAVLVLFGLRRLLRHASVEPEPPTPQQLERARHIATHVRETESYLALLGDKTLLFSPDVTHTVPAPASEAEGFVQYAVSGRSWVALGDPVALGGASAGRVRAELAWRFKEEAHRHGGWPVFYEASPEALPLYIDLGLVFLKLGEEARVDLHAFTLEGGPRKWLRRVMREVEKCGARFEVLPPERVASVLPALRAVSDEWLEQKHVREKGFSLGRFDESYVRYFPVAVVWAPVGTSEQIVAFANLWPGGDRFELSVDMMRYGSGAPKTVMDYLFAQLIVYSKAEGYRWFNLGMAPLAGLEGRQLAPLWAKAGAWLYRHGENFYNYQGLRRYKEKFDPVWEPRYLASPGGIALPRILANVATLISGGISGIVRR
jgi:phosphatidylglycerol lysyltransferase